MLNILYNNSSFYVNSGPFVCLLFVSVLLGKTMKQLYFFHDVARYEVKIKLLKQTISRSIQHL